MTRTTRPLYKIGCRRQTLTQPRKRARQPEIVLGSSVHTAQSKTGGTHIVFVRVGTTLTYAPSQHAHLVGSCTPMNALGCQRTLFTSNVLYVSVVDVHALIGAPRWRRRLEELQSECGDGWGCHAGIDEVRKCGKPFAKPCCRTMGTTRASERRIREVLTVNLAEHLLNRIVQTSTQLEKTPRSTPRQQLRRQGWN